MSKIKMLLDVVQDMRSLTDSLEALARAIEEPEEQQGDAVDKECHEPGEHQHHNGAQGRSQVGVHLFQADLCQNGSEPCKSRRAKSEDNPHITSFFLEESVPRRLKNRTGLCQFGQPSFPKSPGQRDVSRGS